MKSVLSAAALAAFILLLPMRSTGEALDGGQLYEKYCSRCHFSLQKSMKAGRRAERIRSAIKTNIGGMGRFRGKLRKEEIDAIAEALAKVQPK